MSIGFRSWSRSSAVSTQVTEATNLAVDCRYFPPGQRLPPQPPNITAHWPVSNYTAWWQRHMCVNSLPKVAIASAAAGIQTHELLITVRLPNHSAAEPHISGILCQNQYRFKFLHTTEDHLDDFFFVMQYICTNQSLSAFYANKHINNYNNYHYYH